MKIFRTLLFHLYQFVAIYLPGAAVIPVSFVALMIGSTQMVIPLAVLIGVVVLGFAFRARVALILGLAKDYE